MSIFLWKDTPKTHFMNASRSILTDLVDEGVLPLEEARNMLLPAYHRNEEDVLFVFDEFRDVFQLEENKLEQAGHPLYPKFKSGELSREDYTNTIHGFMRAGTEPGLLGYQNPERPS